jgi:hypothetical protein
MPTTILTVRERLDQARARLPEGAARPTLLTSDPGERPIAVIGLTGLNDLRLLGRTANDVHARRLEQIGGVASVADLKEKLKENLKENLKCVFHLLENPYHVLLLSKDSHQLLHSQQKP